MSKEVVRYLALAKYVLLAIFRALSLVLRHGLRGRPRPAHSSADGSFGIVCLSHVPWSASWQRNHHTMYGLSKDRKVLYCHPIVVCTDSLDVLSADSSKRRNDHGSPGLVVIEPMIIAGERTVPLVRAINKMILITEIREKMSQMNMGPAVLWLYSPLNEYLVGSLGELLSVYDIQDEYSEYLGRPEEIREKEKRLLGKVDLVFTGTYALYEEKRKYNENIHFVPCGVDVDHFKKARTGIPALPEDIEHVGHPVVGYFGRVCGRMDTELLGSMADSHPEWSIVLIGEVIEKDFQLERRANVLLLGQKNYADLPQYVQAFDVCMIPFRLNELTLKVNPTKLLEYMAAGKPVVSTAIPDMVRFYGNVIDIAQNKEGFIAAVESTLQNNRTGKSEAVLKGIAIAEGSDWSAMIAKMESFIKVELVRRHRTL